MKIDKQAIKRSNSAINSPDETRKRRRKKLGCGLGAFHYSFLGLEIESKRGEAFIHRRACSKARQHVHTHALGPTQARFHSRHSATREWRARNRGRTSMAQACMLQLSLSLSFLSALLFFHEWIYTRYIASFSPPVRFSTLVTVALFISILFRLYIYIYSMLFTVHHFDYWFWLYLNVLAYFYNTFLILKFRLIDSLSIDEVSFVSVIQGVPRSPVCFTSRKECCTNIDLLYYIEEKFILFPNVVLLRARTWR